MKRQRNTQDHGYARLSLDHVGIIVVIEELWEESTQLNFVHVVLAAIENAAVRSASTAQELGDVSRLIARGLTIGGGDGLRISGVLREISIGIRSAEYQLTKLLHDEGGRSTEAVAELGDDVANLTLSDSQGP
eukprot:UN1865